MIKFITTVIFFVFIVFQKASAQELNIKEALLAGHKLVHSEPDSALSLFLFVVQKSKDSLIIARALTGSANAFQAKSQNDTAVALYFKSLEISDHYGFRQESATIKNNLGSFYLSYGDLNKAEKYLSEALEEFYLMNDSIWIARTTINLAGVDFMQGRIEESLTKLRFSAEIARSSNNLRSEGGTYSNIAIVHESLKQIDSALLYIDKGIEILRKLDDRRGVIQSQKERVQILIKSNRVAEARKTCEEMIFAAKEMDYPLGIYEAYLGWSELEKKEQNYKRAYELILNSTQWKDSVITEKNIETINEITTKYETAKKDVEITLLTKDKERNASERKLFIILTIGTATILALVLFLYFQIKKSRNQLSEKNHIISGALKEKEVLIKETHHRVKNNLQIVSSLLNVQKKFLGNEIAIGAVSDIQTRVESMSLVHQNLYKGNNITDVDALNYLIDLLSIIRRSYDTSNHNIEIVTEIESIALTSTQAVNIGLLITELISNAYKHAFPEEYVGDAEIYIGFNKSDQLLHLEVRDNGVGIKNEYSNSSYGMRLIKSLTKSMNGQLVFSHEIGTIVNIKLPKSE